MEDGERHEVTEKKQKCREVSKVMLTRKARKRAVCVQ